MMAADALLILARANIAVGLAVLVVLALRSAARRWFGAHLAYGLWLVLPAAAAGSLMPTLPLGENGPIAQASDALVAWLASPGRAETTIIAWLGGCGAGIALCLARQLSFAGAIKAGLAGPAAIGLALPRIVVPTDFAERFTLEEARLVRAHEREHMERLDVRLNAVMALTACACWFNPLLHLAARAIRQDQELACDAAVMRRLPSTRRLYAETLLRAQPATAAAPLACHWTARAEHPLETRLRMLMQPPPSEARLELGLAILVSLCALAFGASVSLDQRGGDFIQARDYAKAWEVTGPPCPRTTRGGYGQLRLESQTPFWFDGIRGFFAHGAVTCAEIDFHDGRRTKPFPVCQFSSPFVMRLASSPAEEYFEPGVGQAATVSMRDGRYRCVMGAKITDW